LHLRNLLGSDTELSKPNCEAILSIPVAGGLITTLGHKHASDLGMILPHEHIFLDLRRWNEPGYGEADVEHVIAAMAPEIKKARDAGILLIVETTPVGVGRRPDILQQLSRTTGFPFVLATGCYGEPWTPPWVHAASETALVEWMVRELTQEVEGTDTPANWIKVSVNDNGLTATETKVFRAAAKASRETHATIGSHTVSGTVALGQLDLLEKLGVSLERFVWFHTNREPDFGFHLEAVRRGAWIEYDGIGRPPPKGGPDKMYVGLVMRALDAGLGGRLLLSHDRLGYDPATRNVWEPSYSYIAQVFIPKLAAAGAGYDAIRQITSDNPFRAYATKRAATQHELPVMVTA
jgi:phosphotriesterase-related protein